MLKFSISSYAACFVGKICVPLWLTLGAPLGEGKSGVTVRIVNTKGARRARAGQTPPLKPSPEHNQTCWQRQAASLCQLRPARAM